MPLAPSSPPPLSMSSAHLLSLFFSASYVSSLYLAKNARIRRLSAPDARLPVQPGSRDDPVEPRPPTTPAVIRARLTVVTLSSVVSCAVVYAVVATFQLLNHPQTEPHAFRLILEALGIRFPENILWYLHAPVLFLGPLYAMFLAGTLPGQSNYSLDHHFFDVFWTWIGLRNYLGGPLTEELVFRACVLAVYSMAGARPWKMIAFAPLVFGLAHVHHAWDIYTRHGFKPAAISARALSPILQPLTHSTKPTRAVFQTAYTTLFGAYASFLFLRTRSLFPPLAAHVFCNLMGLPDIGGELQRFPVHKLGAFDSLTSVICALLSCKADIILAYTMGIVLFGFRLGG
ncbi:hypothetical protein C8R46DRAFT_914781 [Mycena filopes]|nr:hypothetical protein C8R46DRAFT_914781 [Mycena filopes]